MFEVASVVSSSSSTASECEPRLEISSKNITYLKEGYTEWWATGSLMSGVVNLMYLVVCKGREKKTGTKWSTESLVWPVPLYERPVKALML